VKAFALFGNPVAHSISPRLHNSALGELGVRGFYGRVLLQSGDGLVAKFRTLGLSGANITIPFKQSVLGECDFVEPFAKRVNSVNTLVLRSGQICGFNTDAPGFFRSVREFGEFGSALVVGAGGTAKALAEFLREKGVSVSVLNRSDRSGEFSDGVEFYVGGLGYKNDKNEKNANGERVGLGESVGEGVCGERVCGECGEVAEFSRAKSADELTGRKFDLVVNTTPSGLLNADLPAERALLCDVFAGAKFAFDAVYGRQTPFLELAKEFSLATKDGSEMLLYQAVLAFEHFFDGRFKFDEICAPMKKVFLL